MTETEAKCECLARPALKSLRAEVEGLLGMAETELRVIVGNTNTNCLARRADEADAALSAPCPCEGSHSFARTLEENRAHLERQCLALLAERNQLRAEIQRLKLGVEWANAEKHSAQADAERHKNTEDRLRAELAEAEKARDQYCAEADKFCADVDQLRAELAEALEALGDLWENTYDRQQASALDRADAVLTKHRKVMAGCLPKTWLDGR